MIAALLLAGAAQACPPEHAAVGHCTLPSAPVMRATAGPPAPVRADAADAIWGAAAMAPARAQLRREHGGGTFSFVLLDIAELRDDGSYRWEGEAWFGGDINRFALTSEGEGQGHLEEAEVQALYARAIGPYFNLQAGVRQDIRPRPARTYLTLGVDGLAPYWFELEAHAFLSNKGDLSGRVAVSYDQRITQRLILQPRAEVNVGQHSEAELDLRLRYEFVREFAPYVGVSHRRGDGRATYLVAGVRAWF